MTVYDLLKQELSDKNVVSRWEPNLDSNCQLVCVKSNYRLKFLSTNNNSAGVWQ